MATSAPDIRSMSSPATELRAIFDKQKQSLAKMPLTSLKTRQQQLTRLIEAITNHRAELTASVSSDFGHRAPDETLSAELLVSVEALRYARRHLRRWMKPQRRKVGLLMASTRAWTVSHPKGVVGIIAPWNYPIMLVMTPLAQALAAGNRVMIKPSEFTPATSATLAKLIAEVFDEDQVTVVTGESDVGIAFSHLPFDHLLFTGSTGIGKHVMRAAAENLTPVTLELGGKSPVLVSHDAELDMAAERICFGKALNAGQTCTAPDYILCPRDRQEELIDALRVAFARMYPTIGDNNDYSSIINDRQYYRLQGLLDDARSKGAKITEFNPAAETFTPGARKMPLNILQEVHDDMTVMQEEIFGPLLPVVSYTTTEEAIAYINARPRPLVINLFDHDQSRIDQVLDSTQSGGFCINDTVMHVAVDDLPFGGSGASGMGRYHGREGFDDFSNLRAVFRRPRWFNSARYLYPPYGGRIQKMLHRLFLR